MKNTFEEPEFKIATLAAGDYLGEGGDTPDPEFNSVPDPFPQH